MLSRAPKSRAGSAPHFAHQLAAAVTTGPAAAVKPLPILAKRTFFSSALRANDDNPTPKFVKRPEPAPSFNTEDTSSAESKQPATLMDDSMIGMSGGQIFHEMMLRHNVDTIFGYSGGAILPVFDGIFNSRHFKFILPRHEQGAGHMAEGYARATGKPGVVVVTSGPGATNVVTPMQDALSDGVPMVVFTGQVPTTAIGTDAFQEADVVGITRSCSKWNVMVKTIEEMPRRINEAFEIATTGRPGPVLVDLPKNVTAGILRKAIPTESTIPSRILAGLSTTTVTDDLVSRPIERAAELLAVAEKPILYVGHGAMGDPRSAEAVRALAKKAQIPVTTTLHGLGAFDEEDPLSLRMVGMHGSFYANRAIQNADLIIAVGARFDERVTGKISEFAPAARLAALEGRGGIIHFEITAKNINKVVETTEAVEGDIAQTLPLFVEKVHAVKSRPEWLGQINEWRDKQPFRYEADDEAAAIRPQTVIKTLSEVVAPIKDKVILTTGVGQHQMWAAQFYKFTHPRTMITSGGLGTMGFGLPAAIGAKVGRPDCQVIDIDGDASFNMTLSEMGTATQFNIPVKVVVFNNGEQGMVTQWQSMFFDDRFAHTHQYNPCFMTLAKSMGWKGIRVEKLSDLRAGLEELVQSTEPTILDVVVDSKVPVLPLVPGGKGLDECIVYDEQVEKERRELRRERLARLAEIERREYEG
ncbi:Acetolactate synthase catalytic subunit, mitochondrial [Wickerhamiella sorbophila]|uniref:Acetolactate synthase n=1 Tax=Wickerhamiella sorbophila TaxID=45607 RepID=A0A2T0FJ10_9ASCO|nr:Acetolactate synthase catalytic subunit, mitochondrial [Wickerhamiella sorbophila]PRT54937.1 Acetolactate synthase catalytic subunit, mitochondrial [Wickerhamiella sorbophila]